MKLQPILNRNQMRAYDRLATELLKIPSIVLMENAGRGAAQNISELLPALQKETPQVAIICGMGNNGGDGFVVARHLAATTNAAITIFLTANVQDLKGDARINYEATHAAGLAIYAAVNPRDEYFLTTLAHADIIVDALFGIGLSREIQDKEATIVTEMNNTKALRIALDISSGLDADTGRVWGVAVRAHHTVTFAYAKPGLLTPEGHAYAGTLHVVPLGVADAKILPQVGLTACMLTDAEMATFFSPRDASTHKYKSGAVALFAGSVGKTGAAKLSAEAALRAGAGLATVCTWPDALPALATDVKEVMLAALDRNNLTQSARDALLKCRAIAVGPGFGIDADAAQILSLLLKEAKVPLVIDADAITLAAHNLSELRNCAAPKILTPHAGELARLLNTTAREIESDRYAAVARATEIADAVVVLKGAHTLIAAPREITRVSLEANPALATAGSGDVLTGIIAACATQMPAFAAACAGVFVHAAAGRLWGERHATDRGMLASDIATLVPEAMGKFL